MIRFKVIEWTVLFLLLVNSLFLWTIGRLDDRILALENGQETYIMSGESWTEEGQHFVIPHDQFEEFKKELEE